MTHREDGKTPESNAADASPSPEEAAPEAADFSPREPALGEAGEEQPSRRARAARPRVAYPAGHPFHRREDSASGAESDALHAADLDWPSYLGETRSRSRLLAALACLVAPGLGYVYVGRFVLGMAVNILFLASFSAFIIAWTILKFFPVWPGLVLIVGWMVMVGLIIDDVFNHIKREQPFVLRPTNHPLIYGAVMLFTFVVPLLLSLDWSLRYVWQRTWAGSDAMYPTAVEGDLVLVDRTAFLHRPPDRGDLVLVEEPEGDDGEGIYFARVVGIPADRVHMEGSLPWVNGQQLGRHIRGQLDEERLPAPRGLDPNSPIYAVVETPYGVKPPEGEAEPKRWYMIIAPARPIIEPTEPVQLDDDEIFVLIDNRTIPFARGDERIGGRVVQREWVVGRPLYVLLSVDPDNGEMRWDRLGVRLR